MTSDTERHPREPAQPTNPDVFNVAGAARYLNMAERTIRLRLCDGSLPGWKLGGVWRISRQALDDHMRTANAPKAKSSGGRR